MNEKRLWFFLALLPAVAFAAAPSASAPLPSDESMSARDVFQIARPSADHTSLEVVESGVRRLESLEEKLSVVAIVGGYHSGKSFMLNALNESFGTRDSGFEMTDSHRATTDGLWVGLTDMTSEVDGSRIALLDTEGFSSAGVAESYDAQIFAVAALLASHLVYNSRNLITAAEVEYLETLARRAHLWSLTTDVGGDMTDAEAPDLAAFPPLTWAVQDFAWDLRGEDPTSWLESFMGGSSDDEPNGKTKEASCRVGRRPLVDGNYSLLGLFREDVRARVFAPPATTPVSRARLRDAPAETLDPRFLAETDAFRGELRRSAASRRSAVDAAPDAGTRGASLAARVRTLVDAARDGGLPELPSLWSSAWESRLVAAAASAALAARDAAARAALETSPPLDPDAFQAALAGARADAERLFKTHLFGLERLWRGPLRETRAAAARRDAEDAAAHDAAVAATLRLAADDAKDTVARGLAAIARPVPPRSFRREVHAVLGPADAAFRERTRAYARCAASRGAARRAARQVASARDAAAAAAERNNAARAAATLSAAVAAGTRAYDLEMAVRVLGDDALGEKASPNRTTSDAPLRASTVASLDAAARVLARRAFRAAVETAGAAWTLETRDGVARLKALEASLERRGEDWGRRNSRLAATAAEAARADVAARAEAETSSRARRMSLPDALLNDTEALVAGWLDAFDARTSGFEDLPERADARASLAGTLGNLVAAARAANDAAWVEALAPARAGARRRLEAEPRCFAGAAGNGLASALRACARDAFPAVIERRAANAWLAAFEDARDAGTFSGKRTLFPSAASADAGAGAEDMSPEALREIARAFAATDQLVVSLRDAARLRRDVLVAVVAAAALLVLPATRSARRGDARRRDRRRRSRTPPPPLGGRPLVDGSEARGDRRQGSKAPNPMHPTALAARQPLPDDDDDGGGDDGGDETAPLRVSLISISSSDGDARDGADDGGFVDVSHDETFDEAEATLHRSDEMFPRPESGGAFAVASADISAATVSDVTRAVEGARRGEREAVSFIRAVGDHPNVRSLIPDAVDHASPCLNEARALADHHESVLRYVRERVSCDDAEWQRTAYVGGVIRRYLDSA